MAEALDVLFESFKFIENKAEHDEDNTRSRSAAVERINLCLLALGKTADLIADWVIVRQVFMVALAVSGCTNTCEFAGNFVCQDGEQLTIGSACPGNASILPASCDYGTDCDDCGPRAPIAASAVYPWALKGLAICIALAGTGIEAYAGYRKYALMREANDKSYSANVYLLKSLNLNRRLAAPRLLLDDLPASVLSMYILYAFPDESGASTVALLVLSVAYSIFAMVYHCCRSLASDRLPDALIR